MANIQCPHCDHETPVPSLEQYLNKKVKCPSCGQTFRVEPESESVEQEEGGAFDFESAPIRSRPSSQRPSSQRPSSRRSNPGAGTRTKSPSLLASLSYDPSARQSSRRYPNLSRYIIIFEIVNKIFFWIGVCGGVLAMLFGVFSVLKIIDSGNSPVEVIISLIFGVPLYFVSIWLAYICAMAGLEFLRVVIDIENNTRE